jgi:hypothetical protein
MQHILAVEGDGQNGKTDTPENKGDMCRAGGEFIEFHAVIMAIFCRKSSQLSN